MWSKIMINFETNEIRRLINTVFSFTDFTVQSYWIQKICTIAWILLILLSSGYSFLLVS
jgi:hypothetical protein